MARASNVMIGTLTLALIAGSLGGWLGYRKYAGIKQQVPFRVIFDGSASMSFISTEQSSAMTSLIPAGRITKKPVCTRHTM